MKQEQISRAICITGSGDDWQVHHNMPGQAIVCHVPSLELAHVICAALQRHAERAGKPPEVWMVEAEHREVPGRKLVYFSTELGAREYAAALRKQYRGEIAWVIVEPVVLDATQATGAAA